jgi:hypothetical protein
VVARLFAAPAVTAEIGAAFVAVGGVLVVSEPPGGRGERWDTDVLGELGFAAARHERIAGFVPERYPRRTGVPGKRPLW